ncbi:Transcription repressor OFP14 [Rhynchospora pubera]|uniref:Transcription repressor n=1 Tax=Rhynchospora pubera TaxID=906938 RepID=A0AAV8C5F8_9POAL|nr:Transcription repressor OFP14 [Rhynchospora pubera]
MKNKIKLPKTIKLFLFKQLRKVLNRLQLTYACTYPKTISTSKHAQNIKCHEATLRDIKLFILNNFPSYYDDTDSSLSDTLSKPSATSRADLALSGSNPSMEPSVAAHDISVHYEGVVVVTSSNDSYEELRSSMMNMLEAHLAEKTQPVDREFLEEFLLRCLEMNEKHMYKSILRAYNDITTEFHQSSSHERENFSNEEVAISSSKRGQL